VCYFIYGCKLDILKLTEISFLLKKHYSHVPYISTYLPQSCSTFYVLRATSAMFGLYAGNVKFNTKNAEGISRPITLCIGILVYFYIHYVQ
jgi:hypothetical protein